MTVPPTNCPLSAQQLLELRDLIDPMQECDDYGVQLYVETKLFVHTCIII